MDVDAEISCLRLALAWLLRSEKRQSTTEQEVDDIIGDFQNQGGAFLPDGQGDRVRESLTRLLSDGGHVGLTRPYAGEPAEARKFHSGAIVQEAG